MPAEQVHIQRIKLKDLPAMAARFIDGAAPGAFIPITKHRAEALVHNPYADPDDVAMLLATESDRCVGYFGAMAVMLQHEGKLHKVHWLTTWAVSPDHLGKGLGSRLMEEALALDVDLAIVGSKPARRVSAKYSFREVKPLGYVQIDFGLAGRYNLPSLSLRALRKLASLVNTSLDIEEWDADFSLFFETIFGSSVRPFVLRHVARKLAAQIGKPEMYPLVQVPAHHKDAEKATRFYRDEHVINWMLAEPWVSPTPSPTAPLKYEFTDWRPGFKIAAFQLRSPLPLTGERPGVREGFAVFQFSRIRGLGVLKVLDFDFQQESTPASTYPPPVNGSGATGEGSLLLAMAIRLARENNAHIIEGPAVLAEPLGDGLLARLLVHRKQRTLQVHPRAADSPLGQAWPHLEQTYVDGDMAFT